MQSPPVPLELVLAGQAGRAGRLAERAYREKPAIFIAAENAIRACTAVNVKPLFRTPKEVLSDFAIHKASFQMQSLSKNQSYSN